MSTTLNKNGRSTRPDRLVVWYFLLIPLVLLASIYVHTLWPASLMEYLLLIATGLLIGLMAPRVVGYISKSRAYELQAFKNLLENAPLAIYLNDRDGNILMVNDTACKMTGYSKKELYKMTVMQLDAQYVTLESCRQVWDRLEGQGAFNLESTQRKKDGEVVEVDLNFSFLSYRNKKYMLVYVKDITTRKQAEHQLREKEMQLRIAIESAREAVIDWDIPSGKYTFNDEFLELIEDTPRSESFTHLLEQYIMHQNKASMKAKFDRIARGTMDRIDGEFCFHTPNGAKWAQGSGQLVECDAMGNGKRFIGTFIDITRRKEMELALAENNQQLKLIIESIPGVVFSCVDDGSTPAFVSDYLESIIGHKPSDIRLQHKCLLGEYILPEDLPSVLRAIEQSKQAGERYSVNYRVSTSKGQQRWLKEIGEYHQVDAPMGKSHLNGIIFDITNSIEEEEKMLTAMIDATDIERTRIAQEIHNSIQQTLVSAYMQFESIKKELDTLDTRQKKRYLDGLEALSQGIEDTRAIARTLMPKQIKDFGYIASVENLIANLDKNIKFEFYHNVEHRLSEKVELNLYRITQEAISNIIKHADPHEVFLQLVVSGHLLTLTIEDDGRGFEPKEKWQNPTYGLQAMQSRATNIGARLEISSKPGQGTFIIVEVPLSPGSPNTNYH